MAKHLNLLPQGFLLKQRFEIASTIDRGGFGIAYRALDLQHQYGVVLSFMQLYHKTKRNLNQMMSEGNPWHDPDQSEKLQLAEELYNIAKTKGMDLKICSQPELITLQSAAKCIDSERLRDLGCTELAPRQKGNRESCECAQSRDIGAYDTCPHGCIYCYAVRNEAMAIKRFQKHNPESEYLFGESDPPSENEKLLVSPQLSFD